MLNEIEGRNLLCQLSEKELAEYGQRSARLTLSLADVQEEKKAVVSTYTAREKEITKEINRLSQALAQGIEEREVSCIVTRNFDAGFVRVVRQDTGEEIENRSFTDDELRLQFEAPDESGAPVQIPATEPTPAAASISSRRESAYTSAG